MPDLKYDVIFTGEVMDGFDVADVKNNFALVFKAPQEKIERFFSSPRVVLKANVDLKIAEKYKAVLTKTGAVVTVEARQPEGDAPTPAENEPAASTEASTETEEKAVGPVWGRKVKSQAAATASADTGEDSGYGSLENGIAGDYQFSIGDTLSEAWQKVSGNKGTTFLAGLLYLAIMIVFGIVTGVINVLLTAVGGDTGSAVGGILTQVAQIVVAAPLGAGFLMLGVSMAIGATAGAGSILGYYDRIVPLALTSLLYGIMVILGMVLLVIPGVYLSVAYILAIPLVADKGLSPWQALEASRKAITRRWFAVFGLLFLLGLLFIAGSIPLLIGLIWVVPLYLIAMGILYRNVFGVSSIAVE